MNPSRSIARAVHKLGVSPWWDRAASIGTRLDRTVPAYWSVGRNNFGDMVAPFIVRSVANQLPIWVSRDFQGKLLSVGSILDAAATSDTIWGSGLIREQTHVLPEDVNVLAVRGPRTAALLRRADVPDVYGDPACLLPSLFQPKPLARRWDVGIVPHYADADAVIGATNDPNIHVIDPLSPWKRVVREICACDFVVSSSLHGLIVAESYGIPAAWIGSPRVTGGGFKFQDYFAGSGRDPVQPRSWEEPLSSIVTHDLPAPSFDRDALVGALQHATSA